LFKLVCDFRAFFVISLLWHWHHVPNELNISISLFPDALFPACH
jgi:hypothetical protein